MVRAFFRLLSLVMLAVAVVTCVMDAARSVAAERLVLTPLGTLWATLSPRTLEALELAIQGWPLWLREPGVAFVLAQPAAAMAAALFVLFAWAGGQRRRQSRRLAYDGGR